MSDIHNKNTRSFNMSQIKSKNTKPEILVRRFLFANGFRYRIHNKNLPGKPDIVLSKYKTVIFVNGCFWHGHQNCKYAKLPKTRTKWWRKKIEMNVKNDENASSILQQIGWKIIYIWTCELKPKNKETCLSELVDRIKNT